MISKKLYKNIRMSDNSDPRNPWGPKKGGSEPQSIWEKRRSPSNDDMIGDFQERIKKMMGGDGGSPRNMHSIGLLVIIIIAVLGMWLFTGLFRVQEGEVGVVMRFGRMTRVVGPGLQYHFPAPFENVIVQKVAAVNRIDGGLEGDAKNGDTDTGLTLTSDENMVIISYSIQWRIKDVAEYLFTARDPDSLIQVAGESAIREILGQTQARQALTAGREEISTKAHDLLQKILDAYKLGVQIVSFQLRRVEAPKQVIESFNDVQASLVDADRLQKEAESYSNQIVPVARGQAEKINQEAQAYAKETVARAEGEASRFSQIYAAYIKNPKIVLARYYLDTMEKVLKSGNKILVDGKLSKELVPYLPVNELRKKKEENKEGEKK